MHKLKMEVCEYHKFKIFEEWREIDFEKDYAPLSYLQLTTLEFPIFYSINDIIFSMDALTTKVFNNIHQPINKIMIKINKAKAATLFSLPISTDQLTSLIDLIGTYKTFASEYRQITDPFEISKI